MNLQPIYDKIVVQQDEAQTHIGNSKIIAPETSKEAPKRGTVLATGPGLLLNNGQTAEMPVKVGQKVLFSHYGGSEVELDGAKYIIMSANDILAILV